MTFLYSLAISSASDGTYYADSSIVVTVVAVNDESPVFNPSSYTTSISEVAAEGNEAKSHVRLNYIRILFQLSCEEFKMFMAAFSSPI